MASLFEGIPQSATSYVTQTTESPKWMQDAIYNQIQLAQNLAYKPYEAYSLPEVAELSPLQTSAYETVQAQQGAYTPTVRGAITGTQGLAGQTTAGTLASAQNPYLNASAAQNMLSSGQSGLNAAAGYDVIGAASPYLASANQMTYGDLASAQSPYLSASAAQNLLSSGQSGFNTAAGYDVTGAANPYLSQSAQATGQALTGSALGSASPYLSQSAQATGRALTGSALGSASPYLASAGQTSAANIGDYMNPYQQQVLDVIASQGARNLTENLLPGVSDAFIKSGQFGSSQMGEMGSRAIRDTQEAILNQQAQAAQQGYTQALSASQADLARQAQLASTAGSLSGQDINAALQGASQYGTLGQAAGSLSGQDISAALEGASQYGTLGQTAGQLTSTQQQNLANIAQGQLAAAQAQQNFGLTGAQAQQAAKAEDLARQAQLASTAGQLTSAQQQNLANIAQAQLSAAQAQQGYGLTGAQAVQAAQAEDVSRQLAAQQQAASLAQTGQQMGYTDTAALEAAGQIQRAVAQAKLDAAKAQYEAELLYPWQQLGYAGDQIRGLASSVPQTMGQSTSSTGEEYSPSPLSQLASAGATVLGLSNLG